MRKIHLHGSLVKHGEIFELDVLTAGEAVAALCANFPAIVDDIRVGSWVVMRGDPKTGMCLEEEAITGMRLGDADLHIMPEILGAKSGSGVIKVILGVTLIALSMGSASFLANPIMAGAASGASWGNAINQLGLVMALSGVSQMLAPETDSESKDDKSFTFTGPVSQQGQGHAVQIVYGEVITGGMMISGGVDADGLEMAIEAPVITPDPATVEADPNNSNFGP